MDEMNRRKFLGQSAGVAAGMLAPAVVTKAFGDANSRIRVAVVGIRGQGGSHIRSLMALREKQNVEIAALCDIDESVLAKRVKELAAENVKPATFTDIRKLLEDKSIDAISTATPNHWHSLLTIWACQAGKDVYVEKPGSHNVWEGRKMVEAARKYNRIVQHGTQSRTSLREGMEKLREGVIGDVYMARALCFKWRDTINRKPDEPVPAGVHYDLWLGPAPKRPFSQNRFHYNWHWHWDYGNGDIGNQGIHEVDIARWGLGVTLPTKVQSMGGHFMFDDDQETPNTQTAMLEFGNGGKKKFMVIDVRHWMSNHEAGISEGRRGDSNTIGNIFYGSKGYMVVDGYQGYRTFLGREQAPGPSGKGSGSHHENFIKAMRSRKVEDLHADIQEGHLSCVLMHLANISYRTGHSIEFDPVTEKIRGDKEASELLTRKYRAPFAVPEKV